MNKLNLSILELKTFTEQDAIDYCLLNDINPLDITELELYDNKLTDISGIKLFKNLEYLYLFDNKITDISVLKDLKKLKELNISDNNIKDISVIQYLKNLKYLNINNNKITDISGIEYLTELECLGIIHLELEFDQIKYIESLKNLNKLYYYKGFKNMSILNQLNKNIKLL